MKHQVGPRLALLLALVWVGAAAADKKPARATTATPSPAATDKTPASVAAPERVASPVEDAAPPVVLREKQFFYGSFGLRDPFRSLVGGDFEPEVQQLVDLQSVRLVGMLWEDEAAYIGIVQDAQGYGYALRPGDPVRNGVVVSVTRHELVGRLNVFGMVDRVNLRLQRVRDEE